ncbi:hypothetical protein C943_00145 [Mariniradius saccharolyticus AK6]|uniref:Uncharacterized protein n=1 Tax=Mariniradius saccharolyticus AK6 TaxID=1239962 RepID=M7Y3T7_9BACT|nr:hypothetical protein C943_00145 [Mariniradius saccharolyticus AK6]
MKKQIRFVHVGLISNDIPLSQYFGFPPMGNLFFINKKTIRFGDGFLKGNKFMMV